MPVWLKTGIAAGAGFSVVGIAFVALSLFTDISRTTWVVLDNAKGVVGFGLCGLAGFFAGRLSHRARAGAAAGAVGGAIAGVTVPVSMYLLAYAFVDAVRQYPFEYYDYLSSGAPSVQAFLRSADGHATVLGTSVGLVPIVVVWAATLGAIVGYVGGRVGRRRGQHQGSEVTVAAIPIAKRASDRPRPPVSPAERRLISRSPAESTPHH